MQLMQSEPPASSTGMAFSKLQLSTNGPNIANDTKTDKDYKALGGLLGADGTEPSYVGATHWAAILDNVRICLLERDDR